MCHQRTGRNKISLVLSSVVTEATESENPFHDAAGVDALGGALDMVEEGGSCFMDANLDSRINSKGLHSEVCRLSMR